MEEKHVIRDVLHGYVFYDDRDRKLLDCRVVQRLRHVRQNDVACFVYPSLNTTRFEHSLGVMHLAGLLAESALDSSKEASPYLAELREQFPQLRGTDVRASFCRAARWYGLLHDIGHLPFSHLTERCLSGYASELYKETTFSALHEAAGEYLVAHDPELTTALSGDLGAQGLVSALMGGKRVDPILQPLKDIVDADVDADRIDGVARDGQLSGGDFGNFDISRLTRHARLWRGANGEERPWRVFFTTRAESAVESLLVERVKTYRWIHYKPKVVAFKNAYRVCFEHALGEDIQRWKAENYVTESGFLDDAIAWSKIAGLRAAPAYVMNARGALLWRWDSARPLWKRREEFRRLSSRVVAQGYGDRWWAKLEKKYPALNLLVWAGGNLLEDLEDSLNDGLPEEQQFVLLGTKFDPFSVEPGGSDRVSAYRIISHRAGTLLRVTEESRLVAALRDAVKAEATFGVTVIIPRNTPPGIPPDLENRFVLKAGQLLDKLGREMPEKKQDDLLMEALG